MPHSTTTITFDKPNYLPGETVNGQVIIENSKPLKTRAVFIKWNGYSKTQIIGNPVCKYKYFYGSKLAWAANSAKNEMPTGTHNYKFSFTLPKDCAPSLKLRNGQNKYKVTVEFDRPWWFNKKVVKEFRVTKQIEDIAKYRNIRPWSWKHTLRSGYLFTSGPISVKTKLPFKAYQPGETFPIKFEIANNSGEVIGGVSLQLVRRTHLHTRHQQKPCEGFNKCHLSFSMTSNTSEAYALSKLHKMDLAPYSDGTFIFPFTIPSEIQTPSFNSGLMTHGYLLNFLFHYKSSLLPHMSCIMILIGDKLDAKKKPEALAIAPPPYTE